MDNKSVRSVYCLLAGSFSLLLFSAVSLAASIDTGKIQPKVANVPVPVSAPPPVKVMPPAEIVLTMTHTASPPPQAPKAVVNTPTYNVRPDPQVKLPPQTVQPKVNIKTPSQNVRPEIRVNVPAQPRTRPQSGRGNGYGDEGYGRHYYGRTAYNPATQRLPANPAIPLPKTAPAQISKQPRAQSKLNVSTPGGANGIGGSRVDRQTLDRIQGIQEAATAAQVFKQLEELKNAQDIQNIGAAKRGFGGDQAGPLGDGGIGFGAVSGEGSNGPGSAVNKPRMGAIDRSASADPAEGSRFGAPGRIDESRTAWVSGDTTTETTTSTADGVTTTNTTTTDGDGNIVMVGTETSSRTSEGGTNTRSTKQVPGSGEVIVTETITDAGGNTVLSSSTTIRELAAGGYKYDTIYTSAYEGVADETNTGTAESLPAGIVIWQPNENYDNQNNDCVKGAGGCTGNKTKPKDMITQPSEGDADADPGSSPIIGAAAVTNEDEFHSGGGGGGGRRVNKDMLTQPPTEGAEGGGGTPPAPSGASLEEALGDAALH